MWQHAFQKGGGGRGGEGRGVRWNGTTLDPEGGAEEGDDGDDDRGLPETRNKNNLFSSVKVGQLPVQSRDCSSISKRGRGGVARTYD